MSPFLHLTWFEAGYRNNLNELELKKKFPFKITILDHEIIIKITIESQWMIIKLLAK